MREFLEIIAGGDSLTREQAETAMHTVMRGEAEPEETAAFLVGLRSRGETIDELVGFTTVMRDYAVPVNADDDQAIDLCGTGGDARGTFNISTGAALVCAGAGVTVAKHGNRSVSSKCGSADVLEALGAKVELGKEGVEYCIQETGIAFIFAPFFHPAMRHVMPVRRKLGIRTFFNILGPLCNPAGVRRQLVGAFNLETAQMMAGILEELGAEHVVTVHAQDGLDEITLSTETTVFEYNAADRGKEGGYDYFGNPELPAEAVGLKGRDIAPEEFGFGRTTLEELRGGSAVENADIIRRVLSGEEGPARDVVVLNAAFALHTSGRFGGIDSCVEAAKESIDSGAARERLARFIEASRRAPEA